MPKFASNFYEMDHLKFYFSWVKFQEDVEEGGKRWSKPFVPALQVRVIH